MKIIRSDAGHLVVILLAMIFFVACDLNKESRGVSGNLSAFQEIFELNIKSTSVQWEIFSSPEQTGLQVGPSESTVLIAELTPLDTTAFSLLPPGEEIFYVPEAARSWLDKDFQSLFQKKVGRVVSLSPPSNCRPLKAVLKKTWKSASGFICQSGTKALIYLTIASDSVR